MRKAVIWDLDGTLFDSYDVIVESISLTFREYGVELPLDEIHDHAIKFSIRSLFAKVSERWGVPAEELQRRYSQVSGSKYLEIMPMYNSIPVLKALEAAGVENYVFTHRGKTTLPVLENLGMTGFFRDIITSQNGFPRKPDPEGLCYLLCKYELDPENTYYVGDRALDMDCARNAGIPGVLFLPEGSVDVSGGSESFIIHDLLKLLNIVI